jgi:autotransporter-associated beta strand protein
MTASALLALAALLFSGLAANAQEEQPKPPVRELLVPFRDLNVLLQGQPQRMLLSRAEYEELQRKAAKTPQANSPYSAELLSAEYTAALEPQRALISGTLVIDVLTDGLHGVPLDLGSVGLRGATLDGRAASIGQERSASPVVFVEGRGRHELRLDMVAAVETTAARQSLHLRLPRPAAARMHLTVPGDVEIQSGAEVIRRTLDEAAALTRFELLPPQGDWLLVMTLNSHLQRQSRAVVARSVVVAKVTQAYERLDASVSMEILHRAVDQFRFVVPAGFEITEVRSPLMARWAIVAYGPPKVLEIQLRQATTETVVLNLSALRVDAGPAAAVTHGGKAITRPRSDPSAAENPPRLESWSMPTFEPLDVVGQVAVVGLLVERRLKVESLAASDLISVDTSTLDRLYPDRAAAEPGASPLEAVAAYYAPQAQWRLTARFTRPPVRTKVTSSLVLTLDERQQQLQGSLLLAADEERLFDFNLAAPAEWQMVEVSGDDGRPLGYERFETAEKTARYHVTLPQGVAVGQQCRVRFRAIRTPPGWLDEWTERSVEFPKFDVVGGSNTAAAIAVAVGDDLTVRPETIDQLTPLDEDAKGQFDLSGALALAYRCEGPHYQAKFLAGWARPRLTARTFSFVRVEPDALAAHYEVLYEVAGAHVRQVALLLPETTPQALEIRGLGGLKLKQYANEPAGGGLRRWNVLLEDAHVGPIRLAVDFQQPLAGRQPKNLPLPIVRADGVAYQSGLLAVEGSPELDVQLSTAGVRRVDVGELADAEYQPGRRLLGAFGFVGDSTRIAAEVKISVARHPGYPLYGAIVEQALLQTLLSAEGLSLTNVVFTLRAEAVVLEVRLPPQSQLWSAYLDAQPILPQRDRGSVLVDLPPAATRAPRQLRIIYQTPIRPVAHGGRVELPAPGLWLRAGRETAPVQVPLAHLEWNLELPPGYEVVRGGGTLESDEIRMPTPAPVVVGGLLYELAGGVTGGLFMSGGCGARESARLSGEGEAAPKFAATGPSATSGLPNPNYVSDDTKYSPSSGQVAPPANVTTTGSGGLVFNGGSMTKSGGGTLVLKNSNDYSGAATLNGGTLTKSDSGSLTLGATNTFTGGTTINAGTLQLGSTSTFTGAGNISVGPLGVIIADGNRVSVNGQSITIQPGATLSLSNGTITNKDGQLISHGVTIAGVGTAAPSKPGAGERSGEGVGFGGGRPMAANSPQPGGLGGFDARIQNRQKNVDLGAQWSFQGGKDLDRSENAPMERAAAKEVGVVNALMNVSKASIPPAPSAQSGDWGLRTKAGFNKLHGLETLRSPLIDFQAESPLGRRVVRFQSLGEDPRLDVTLAQERRTTAWGWVLALTTFLIGVALERRSHARKASFVLLVAAAAMLAPWAWQTANVALAGNMVFYAVALVVLYYAIAAPARWMGRGICGLLGGCCNSSAAVAAAVLLAVTLVALTSNVVLADPDSDGRFTVQVIEPPKPVNVPEDAILRPYDATAPDGVKAAERLLIPYAKYVELWNLAHPDKKLQSPTPPADYALAGARYQTTLVGDDYLQVLGRLEIELFVESYVVIPLNLKAGVLAKAELDGRPARLQMVGLAASQASSGASPSEEETVTRQAVDTAGGAADASRPLVLYVAGKGRHTLELEVRLRLERHGGWRAAEGNLPAAPATMLAISVVDAETEVRLGHVPDRPGYETSRAGQRIETALGPDGAIAIQWRPKLAQGQVDQTLTCQSISTFDVAEDGLHWRVAVDLQFRRGQRDAFAFGVPGEYLVEKVEGPNVRGWTLRTAPGRTSIEVALLKPARDHEQFTVSLCYRGPTGHGNLAEFLFPELKIDGAAMHSGHIDIRRSPLMELRVLRADGVTRTDVDASEHTGTPDAAFPLRSPIGLRSFQSYNFMTTPFSIRLAATEIPAKFTAQVQSIVRISEYQRNLDARVLILARERPIYTIELFVPDDLHIERLTAPGAHQWAVTAVEGRRLLSIYLADGGTGEVPLLIEGTLGSTGPIRQLTLPRIEVRGGERQQGDMAVQVDPAFDVEPADLHGCRPVLLEQLFGWLKPEQRSNTRLALAWRQGDYGGTLRLAARKATVNCFTISNVRVTSRAIEETILLEFSIQGAGIRQLAFLLPASKEEPRVEVPFLRQKTVRRTAADGPWQVNLELQEERSGQLRVLVGNDRVLSSQQQSAPIPIVQTGHTDRQFVVLESSGRDEVAVETSDGLDPLGRHQSQWQMLKGLLGTEGITQAYLVAPAARNPRLTFRTHDRETLETAGARIGLAETNLAVDGAGGYRGQIAYQVSNTIEQFLEIRLPPGAALWTAQVAGEPVKPTRDPANANPLLVRIPLVKTAAGELPYPVVLKYGGRLPPPGNLGQVSFPLIHTVNIHVDLSQARLYLPDTHSWFNFGGTMHPAADEAGLTAGQIAFDTRETEKLRQIIHGGDSFARLRAADNLKTIVDNAKRTPWFSFGSGSALGSRSALVQSELAENQNAVQQAQEDLKKLDAGQDKPVARTANASTLNDLFNSQVQLSNPSRNVVNNAIVGSNFYSGGTTIINGGSQIVLGAKQPLGVFGNQQPAIVAQEETDTLLRYKQKLAQQSRSQAATPAESNAYRPYGSTSSVQQQFARAVPPQLDESRKEERGDLEETRSLNRRRSLGEQSQPSEGLAPQESTGKSGQGGEGVALQKAGTGYWIAKPTSGTSTGGPATGLASLDVQLPWSGQVYRFTTPLGEVEITAWAISKELSDRLTDLPVILATLVLAAVGIALVRWRFWNVLVGRRGSTHLIWIGLLMACFGIFAVVGVAAMVAGVTAKIVRMARGRPRRLQSAGPQNV